SLFLFCRSRDHRDLHSFPTRRSSDLGKGGILFSVVRVKGSPPIRLRSRGPRALEEIPLSELQVLARYMVERHGYLSGSEEHLRRSEEHTSELQSRGHLVCRLLLEKKK